MEITNKKRKQFEDIADDCMNGNWTTATEKCVKNGFSGIELVELYEDREDEMGEEREILSLRDIVLLTMYTERMINARLR